MTSHPPESVENIPANRAVPSSPDDPAGGDAFSPPRAAEPDPRVNVRAADLEPYVGLKYLSRLFKLMAVVLIVLLVSDIIYELTIDGYDAVMGLVEMATQFIVLAGLLWGVGDLAILLIDMGHDLRATRILIGRQLAHHVEEHHSVVDPRMAGPI